MQQSQPKNLGHLVKHFTLQKLKSVVHFFNCLVFLVLYSKTPRFLFLELTIYKTKNVLSNILDKT